MLADLRLADPFDDRLDLALLGRVHVELDARIEVLDVLANDDQIDVTAWRGHARLGLRGSEVRVQVELLAEGDVDRAEARPELGRERALERDAVSPHGLERVLRERRAVLCHRGHADVVDIPLDLHTGRFDRTAGRRDDLRARAVTRNERDRMRQDALPLASTTSASYFGTLRPAERPRQVAGPLCLSLVGRSDFCDQVRNELRGVRCAEAG